MVSRPSLLLFGLLGACATPQGNEPADELAYRCSDLVAIGRIVTVSSTSIADPAPLPNWNGLQQLEIRIKRVVRGSEARRFVPASVISHAQIRSDRDFLVILSPDAAGRYALEAAAPWDQKPRPRAAEPCS
jgi:hypothetical protein